MNALLEAGLELQEFLRARGWPFAIIGGLAVLRWGEPRTTIDVDLTLLTGYGGEEPFVDALLGRFKGRIGGARLFALERRVLLLQSGNGTNLDVSLGGLPFEAGMIGRASDFAFGEGCTLRTCSAEDLVVFKAFAGRPQDWRDVEGILARHGGTLDLALVRNELGPLAALKDQPDILGRLETLLGEAGLV